MVGMFAKGQINLVKERTQPKSSFVSTSVVDNDGRISVNNQVLITPIKAGRNVNPMR